MKKKKLQIAMIVVLLLIITLSVSYAFFDARVNKTNGNALAGITTKRLSLAFTDGPAIVLDGILPGQKMIKTFSVVNNSSDNMIYSINFKDVINELTRTQDLVYTLSGTNGGSTVNETPFPTSDEIIVANASIGPNATQEYTLTIEYKNADIDQSIDMDKMISATIEIGEEKELLRAGLYNANDELIISYEDLVANYNFDPSVDLNGQPIASDGSCQKEGSPACIVNSIPNAKKLILPSTLTNIGNYTFYNSNLESIIIPETVTNINTSAFYGSQLKNVEFIGNSSLTSIGQNAFYGTQIRELNVPSSVTTIGSNAFGGVYVVNYNGEATSSSNWGATIMNPDVETDGFIYTDNTKTTLKGYLGDARDVVIPNTVTSIANMAFKNSDIDSVTIPASVVTIGSQAFQSSKVTTVNFASNSSLTTIGSEAFGNTQNLNSITIPASVTTLSAGAFYLSGLRTCNIEPNSQLATIGSYAFTNYYLDYLELPDTLTTVEDYALNAVKVVVYNGSINLASKGVAHINPYIEGDFAYSDSTKTTLYAYLGTSKNITIPASVRTIGTYAFENDEINSITFNGSETSIGGGAFLSAKINNIEIPSSVTLIDQVAFYQSEINSITFAPNSQLASIGQFAFGYAKMDTISLPSSLRTIGNLGFYQATLTSVSLPNGLESIGDQAFERTKMESINVPSSVTTIGSNAFNGMYYVIYSGSATGSPWGAKHVNPVIDGDIAYSDSTKTTVVRYLGNSKNVTIPSTVTEIGDYSFEKTAVESVTIQGNVTRIGNNAFSESKLKTINLPSTVTVIDSNAFNQSQLESITLPNGITTIGNSAFRYTNITSINLPNTITSLGNSAFSSTKIRTATLPTGIDSIPSGLFQFSSLESITIPASVIYIAYDAFYYCNNLESVTFETTTGWTKDGTTKTPVDVTDPAANAEALRTNNSYGKFWSRSNS